MDHKLMAQAAEAASAVAAGVSPDQYDRPTPCPGWDVRALANHLTHWTAVISERRARKEAPLESEDENTDYTGGDWPAFFAARVERAVAAWGEPGAWDGEITLVQDPLPAQMIGTMLFAELVMHGWDLAAATGQSLTVAPEVADAALRAIAGMAEMGREWGAFGPEVVVPADAPDLDKALALSGRDPGWRP
jgi:uncharacterized protein (TIGR03086 family)